MDEEERRKKLEAGRDRLAKFQNKKKKKKKKETKAQTAAANGDTSAEGGTLPIEMTSGINDSLEDISIISSDMLGSSSDVMSSFGSEFDQKSIGTDDLCEESDASQLDVEVARVELMDAKARIHELEEKLLGKEMAMEQMEHELSRFSAGPSSTDENGVTNNAQPLNSGSQEVELRAALEQYNIKIQEFQNALVQRDQVIRQLSANLQSAISSRDIVQAEASAHTAQLSTKIQLLQNQLQETGETLRNQSGEQVTNLAEELTAAQSQVMALQQNCADKDAIMQQLSEKYSQKAMELIQLAEDRELLKRNSASSIASLKEQLQGVKGDQSFENADESIMRLQCELDESYGNQIVMMKQQLDDKYRQEVEVWKQRCGELERLAAASSDNSSIRNELETQLGDLQCRLSKKDSEIMSYKGNMDNLSQKLVNLAASYEKKIADMEESQINEMEMVKDQIEQKTRGRMEELTSQLKEVNAKVQDLESEIEDNQRDSTLLKDSFKKEIDVLTGELEKKDEELQELNQVRIALEDQFTKISTDEQESLALSQKQLHDLSTESELTQIALDSQIAELQEQLSEAESKLKDKEMLRGADDDDAKRKMESEMNERDGVEKKEKEIEALRNEVEALQAELERVRAAPASEASENIDRSEDERNKDVVHAEQEVQLQMDELQTAESHESKSPTVDVDALRETLADEIRSDFQEDIEDMKYEYESKIARLRAEIELDFKDDMKKVKKEMEHHYNQKVENIRVAKEHEFVAELRKVRDELKENFDKEVEAKVKEKNETGKSYFKTSEKKGDVEGVAEMERLKAEVQELSEARDALLQQIDQSHHEQEEMQEQLLQVMSEKDQVVGELQRLQLGTDSFSPFSSASDPFSNHHFDHFEREPEDEDKESLMKELKNLKEVVTKLEEDKLTFQDNIRKMQDKTSTTPVSQSSEGAVHSMKEEEEKPTFESLRRTEDFKEMLQEVTKERDQLMTDKEELQHKLETQEKEFEAKSKSGSSSNINDPEYEKLRQFARNLEKEIDGLEPGSDLEKAQRKILKLHAEAERVEMLETQIKDLSDKFHQLDVLKSERDLENQSLREENDKIKHELEGEKERTRHLLTELQQTESELLQLGCLEVEVNALKNKLKEMEDQMKNIEKEKMVWQNESEELQGGIEKVQKELYVEKEIVSDLQEKLNESEQKVADLQQSTDEISELEQQVQELGTELQNVLVEKESIKSERDNLVRLLDDKETNLQEVKEEELHKKDLVQELEGSISAIMEENSKPSAGEKIADLKGRVSQIQEEREALQSENNRLDDLVKKLKEEKELNAGNVEELRETLEGIKQENEDLRIGVEEVCDLREQVKGVETQLQNVDLGQSEILREVQEKLETERFEVTDLKIGFEEAKEEERILREEIGQLKNNVHEVEQLKMELEDMAQKVKFHGNENEKLRNKVSVLTEEKDATSENIAKLSMDLEERVRKEAKLKEEVSLLHQQIEDFEKSLDEQKDEKERLLAVIENLQSEIRPESEVIGSLESHGGDAQTDCHNIANEIPEVGDATDKNKNLKEEVNDMKEKLDDERKENISLRELLNEKKEEMEGESGDVHLQQLSAELEVLKERLEYIEQESVREKKEYEIKLRSLERDLIAAVSYKAVADAQMKALQITYEDEMLEIERAAMVVKAEREELKFLLKNAQDSEIQEGVEEGSEQQEADLQEEGSGQQESDLQEGVEEESEQQEPDLQEGVEEGSEQQESDLQDGELLQSEGIEGDLQERDMDGSEAQELDLKKKDAGLNDFQEILVKGEEIAGAEDKVEVSDGDEGDLPEKDGSKDQETDLHGEDNDVQEIVIDGDERQEIKEIEHEVEFSNREKIDRSREEVTGDEKQEKVKDGRDDVIEHGDLKEKLMYVEQESVKEKMEYENKLQKMETDLLEVTAAKAVIDAQLSAQKVAFEQEMLDLKRQAIEARAEKEDLKNLVRKMQDETKDTEEIEDEVKDSLEKDARVEEPITMQQQMMSESALPLDADYFLPTELSTDQEDGTSGGIEETFTSATDHDRLFNETWESEEMDNLLEIEEKVEESISPEENAAREQNTTQEHANGVQEMKTAQDELERVKGQICLMEKEKETLQEKVDGLEAEIQTLAVANKNLLNENERLDALLNQENDQMNLTEMTESLKNENVQLRRELKEAAEAYSRESDHLREALEHERALSSSQDATTSSSSLDGEQNELDHLREQLLKKEQTEHEILTEKNRQIGILQESNARLERENEDLSIRLTELTKTIQASEAVSEEVQEVFGKQLTDLHTQQQVLQQQLEEQKADKSSLIGNLDESNALELSLREEKDLLLQKLEEKELIQDQLTQEKMDLQKQLDDKHRLEALLLEKDRLEQELSRQKRGLEGELKEIEGQLKMREEQLLRDKLELQAELKQKDYELKEWEVGFKEQQLQFHNKENLLQKHHKEKMVKDREGAEENKLAHLEHLRTEMEKRHAEAVAKLRKDLQKEFGVRETKLTKDNLSQISGLREQHQSQLRDLQAEMETRMQELRQELEKERKKQLGAVKSANERLQVNDQENHQQQLDNLQATQQERLSELKQELDHRHQQMLDELQESLEEAHRNELEQEKANLEAKHRKELELAKRMSDTIQNSQLEELKAKLDEERAKALSNLQEQLMEVHREEIEKQELEWQEKIEKKEKAIQDKMEDKHAEASTSSKELILQLHRRLSDEHKEVILELANQWDQQTVERLEALKAEMEGKHLEELDAERHEYESRRRGEFEDEKEKLQQEYQSDVDSLLGERKMLVEHADDMRKKLESIHHQELAQLRAAVQAEYDQLSEARAELEKSKSQTEKSLQTELEKWKDAYHELQEMYATEVDTLQRSVMGDDNSAERFRLEKEVQALQSELTNQRAKLQGEHDEELEKLRAYFEERFAENEEKWAKDLEGFKAAGDGGEGSASSFDERDEFPVRKPNISHSMMTLTHISDTESSPPRSPQKFMDVEADFKQQLRQEIEKDYQNSLKNLRNELENEHKAQISRLRLESEFKYEDDLQREKDVLKSKHAHALNVMELDHINTLENLRSELQDAHNKQIAKMRLEAVAETARQVQSETYNIKKELMDQHEKESEELRSELAEKFKNDLTSIFESQRANLRNGIEGEVDDMHKEEIEKLREEFEMEKRDWEEKMKEQIRDGVAKTLSDSLIGEAVEEESQREELFQKNDLIAQLKRQLAESEERTKQLSEDLEKRSVGEFEDERQRIEEKTNADIEVLQKQLEEEKERMERLRQSIQVGDAPEIQDMRENLIQQYDAQLEMMKETMNEELEALTRMMQQQSARDLEEMQAKFVEEHEQMMEKFSEDQEKMIEEMKLQHSMDVENMKKQMQWQQEQDKEKELQEIDEAHIQAVEDLKKSLQEEKSNEIEKLRMALDEEHGNSLKEMKDVLIEEHEKEMAKLQERHQEEVEEMKMDLVKTLNAEKERMDHRLQEELKRFGNAEEVLEQIRENHLQEKERLKEELITSHMEKFKKMTDELEAEHTKEVKELKESVRKDVEVELGKENEKVQEDVIRKTELRMQKEKEDEITELNERHKKEVEEVKSDLEERIQAMAMDSEKEIESTKSELEEAHLKEVLDLQKQMAEERLKEMGELQGSLLDTVELLKKQHEEEIKGVKEEYKTEMERLNEKQQAELEDVRRRLEEEQERVVQELKQKIELLEGEKGSLDALLKEREEKWTQEAADTKEEQKRVMQSLLDNINEVQEEKASLAKQILEKDDLINRRERENEEGKNLIVMLQGDIERITTDRNTVQHTNNHILQVLSQVTRANMSMEETITKCANRLQEDKRQSGVGQENDHPEGREPEGGAGGDDPRTPKNVSITSSFSDEGLELSQQLAESMFAGPELDTEGEELINLSNQRLQMAVEQLIEMVVTSSAEIEQARALEIEFVQNSASSQEESSHLRSSHQQLSEKLRQEVEDREKMAMDLDKTEGLMNGLQAEKAELEKELEKMQNRQHELVVELETLKQQVAGMEIVHQDHVEPQQVQMLQAPGPGQQDLATELSKLHQENNFLQTEKVELKMQSAKDKEAAQSQIQTLEAALEEQLNKMDRWMEEKQEEVEDLQRQLEAADKQYKASKQFLEHQGAEREQEREEFQREIKRLEENLHSKDKASFFDEEDIRKELQETKDELEEMREEHDAAAAKFQELEMEMTLKGETVHDLTSQIKDLERLLEEQGQSKNILASKMDDLEQEILHLHQVEEEKEELQKQCYDQLLQISALQSKLDAHKHGIEVDSLPSVEEDEDDVRSLGAETMAHQLEQDREALERKDKEIEALVEQLEQFREDLLNKEDEISQLQLQLEVASTGQHTQEGEFAELQEEREQLQEQVVALKEELMNQAADSGPSIDQLTQDLLQEKNQELDDMMEQLKQTENELMEVRQALEEKEAEVKEDEDQVEKGKQEFDQLKSVLEQQLREKGSEIEALREQVDEADNRDVLAEAIVVETLEKVKMEASQKQEATKSQLEQEMASVKQLLGVRDREVAQLEAQLVTMQGNMPTGKTILEETVEKQEREIEEKDLQLTQLKIQVDQTEEALFQAQQQLQEITSLQEEMNDLKTELDQLQADHDLEMTQLKEKHKEQMKVKNDAHHEEVDRLKAAQEEDWARIQQLEQEYDHKMAGLGRLSPGKTLEQKIDEIREELTKQHQQHIADIQHTMAREADLRIEQLKAEQAQAVMVMEERHQHELEQAVLRTNRDLMAAHAEEVAKMREEHRQELDSVRSMSSFNMTQLGDLSQMVRHEIEIAQMRGRPAGVGQEPPSQADSGASCGDTGDLLPDKLQAMLARIQNEGLQVLALSDLRYLHDQTTPRGNVITGLEIASLQEAWDSEKRALLDAMQALKDLITHMNNSPRISDPTLGDWRGELLKAIQKVFEHERESLLAELRTNVAMMGDQNLSDVQILQRRIKDQESFHKSAVEQIYGADRSSMLHELRDLYTQNEALRTELQQSRQKLTQQLRALEDQSQKREKQLKRQVETMEHKFRQERIIAEDLRTSLDVEQEKVEQLHDALNKERTHVGELREEISDLLMKVDRQIADKEDMESRMADVTFIADNALAALDSEKYRAKSLNDTLNEEKRAAKNLRDALEKENQRVHYSKDKDQQIIRELRKDLQKERNGLVEATKSVEQERLKAEALSRQLETAKSETVSEVQHEKTRFTEMKTALDVERSRCQELKTALQREQVLNAQMQTTLDKERQSHSEASVQEKTVIAQLQGELDAEKSLVLDLQGQLKQLENNIERREGIMEAERLQSKEGVAKERAVVRQLKGAMETIQNKLKEVENHLISEQERSARLQAERDRLQAGLASQKEKEKSHEAHHEREREGEKRKQLEREREKEMERQRQRDHELEHQLDQQKINSLEEQVDDWKQQAQQAMEDLQRLREEKNFASQKVEEEEDEIRRVLEEDMPDCTERLMPAGREENSSRGQGSQQFNFLRDQLESIRQRLQLIAARQQEGLGVLQRGPHSSPGQRLSPSNDVHSLERTIQEVSAELKQIHGALVLQGDTVSCLASTRSRLNTRLLNQNAELSNYISRLSQDKTDLRNIVSQLEEENWDLKQRQLQQNKSPSKANRRDLDGLFAEERASWEREKRSTQTALRQAEREIIHLKMELEHEATQRRTEAEFLLNGIASESQQQKIQRLYGKYLRAESFRKSLVYQKKYLLLLLGGFQDTEEAALALIAKMGAHPNLSDMQGSRLHSRGFTRFRSAVRVCIAVSRMKYLMRKWHKATRSSTGLTTAISLLPNGPTYHSVVPRSHLTDNRQRGTASAPPFRISPPRTDVLRNEFMSASPPVRDRVLPRVSNGIHEARTLPSRIPLSAQRSGSSIPVSTPSRDHPEVRPHDPNEDPEASLTRYIQKLENLQSRLGGASNNRGVDSARSSRRSRSSYPPR